MLRPDIHSQDRRRAGIVAIFLFITIGYSISTRGQYVVKAGLIDVCAVVYWLSF